MADSAKPIVVVGAGLSGCCIALLLSKLFKETQIILVEARDDYRKELQRIHEASKAQGMGTQFDNAATRSINLALSHRGICALKECGIFQDVLDQDLLILMKGRYVHLGQNKTSEQLYGQDHEGIFSISRLTLNCLFLDKLSAVSNVDLKFQCKVTKITRDGVLFYSNAVNRSQSGPIVVDNVIDAQFVLGCDGIYSSTRSALQRLGRYDFEIKYIDHGYKELTIFPLPAADGKGMDFAMPPNYLHIWPKHEFMIIGLPNPDKTFTCTLFAPWDILEALCDRGSIERFFKAHFADFTPLCPDYVEQCLLNPSSPLAHVHLSRWNFKGKLCLLGDAAHGIVPFYGQGMNAAFESCLILFERLKESVDGGHLDLEQVFDGFSADRQPSTAALSRLSLQNYVEMRSLTAKKWFVYKKKLEKVLNYYAPNLWRPLYSMVAFSRTPYHEAQERAKKQDRILTVALSGTAIATAASAVLAAQKYDAVGRIQSAVSKHGKL